MIKGIIFDLDDTLTVHEKIYNIEYINIAKKISEKIIDKNTLELIIDKIDKIGSKKYFEKYLDAKFGGRDILWGDTGGLGEVNGYISSNYNEIRSQIWKEISKIILESNSINIPEISNKYIHNMWSGIKAFDDVLPVLLKLKKFKLAVLSNGTPALLKELVKSNNLDNIFDDQN